TGEGAIYGENCIYKFLKLFKVKEQSGSGILCLPNIKPFYAFFSGLEFSADPTPELISYKFVFREDSSKQESLLVPESCYITDEGEDLWDVAYRFNVPIETLVKLNPELRSVNDIEEGTRVRVC
ncbi:MAG: LysM peptidoglycan-binding domain-containing protein, partial [Ruminococcus sp.]|nr:LysM peptidoglycan-binding domain-containing protein [Ruminococcus sp.]